MKLTAPRLMVFFVAFENGFFWKGYLEKQREDFRKGEGMSKGIVKKTDTNDKGKS